MTDKILLIGNAPNVLEYKMKDEIDAFPLVARFNDFITHGFEEHIGTKTDIWIRSSLVTKHKNSEFSRVYFAYPPILEGTFGSRSDSIIDHNGNKVFDKNVIAIPTKFYIEVNKKHIAPPNWASTGLLAIFYFLDKNYDVTIHGFDSFASSKIHYYPDSAEMRMHNAPKERAVIADLIANNTIKSLINV